MRGPASIFIFDHFHVRPDRMVCDLRMAEARFAALDAPGIIAADLADRLVERFPSLPDHACVNDSGPTFGSCMAHASMPHLLEHVVIALQAEAEAADSSVVYPLVFVGTTRWTDRAALAARIEVNYRDDVTAFCAFRDAAAIIDSIVLE